MRGKIVIYGAMLLSALLIFGSESVYIYKWYLALLVLGVGFFPISRRTFTGFADLGYIFSKVIGVALAGMTVFWLVTFVGMPLTPVCCTIVTLLLIAAVYSTSYYIGSKKNGKTVSIFFTIPTENLNMIINEELIFLVLLIALLYMKSFLPAAYGTEKFMDYAFMNAFAKAKQFPVEDVWFSGENLNYYYMGQYFAAFINQLSFNNVRFTYNIMFYTNCALAFVMAFACGYRLIQVKFDHDFKKKYGYAAGLLSAGGVCFAGSAHFIVYGIILVIYNKIIGNDSYSYWFPASTRYVGYEPERADKTITETPSYSFVIGDLHAHVCNIMFVLVVIGLLIAFASTAHKKLSKDKSFGIKTFSPAIILCGIFIGIFQGNNYWDYPIYMMVTALTIIFVDYKYLGFNLKTTLYSLAQIILLFIMAFIIILPFSLYFVKMEGGVRFAENHTLPQQLFVLWGLPVICAISYIICAMKDYFKDELPSQKNGNKLYRLITHANIADLMVALFGCCAIGLVIIPEIIYIKDIYGIEWSRANTTFKLTYQSCIMFGIITGFAIVSMYYYHRTTIRNVLAKVLLGFNLVCMAYFFVSCHSWFGDIFDFSRYRTLDAMSFMPQQVKLADDVMFVEFINAQNFEETPTILEATGDAYTDTGRMSVATGYPTVLGWYAHEWLWRFDQAICDQRTADIRDIYCCYIGAEDTKALIQKYDIDYIYIGTTEYEKYTDIDINKLLSLGEVVAEKENTYLPGYQNYLIKVK
ncbi:DUF2298 domain-containing protein [Pseudobutyrivibrio xylanivorans]|uniref:Chlor_Arch_YYY domain-containing protein n=1 Tax=Pseudobutyrivibrio xylanivorans TaxID=185007 RepID=A0A5P6VW52_PSEXY|nr:DUF2298 domain-containing protein [Pseudobutyrivibrio xylanivorans]QFJ56344.1 hypothetical protein FXF36_15630 [Pseudobutyrivibrio xylanivorans]